MQNYMLERILERISVSKYRQNFILKGGYLIAAMVGLDTRATMDMDVTIKGWPVNENSIKKIFLEICEIDLDDDVKFDFKRIGEIREGDEYTGYRVSLLANYPPMAIPLKLDITTGDKITPEEIEFRFKMLLEEREIAVLAYNLETILAEKLETVITRGDQNTRLRDYYDIFVLAKLYNESIKADSLKEAINATSRKRGSIEVLKDYKAIIEGVKNSNVMKRQWGNYQKDFEYAAAIPFDEVCDTVIQIMNVLTVR
ncbi:MAG TPA: abortive phage infection protein [Erysipelotrichaceae bacterium]|nr:abortive phage infection protein [Erysipelotrichaceae bacterium]